MAIPKLIFCCGMIRSGSTVLYQMAAGIVEMRGIGQRCGYYEPPAEPEPPSWGWSVYKVPWLCEREQRAIRNGAIALYSHRDIEESLTSAYRAFGVPEGNRWLWRALCEGAEREMRAFDSPAVNRIPFSSIRESLGAVIAEVAAIIPGRTLAAEEIGGLIAELSLDRQRSRPKVAPYDPHTLICPQHFN